MTFQSYQLTQRTTDLLAAFEVVMEKYEEAGPGSDWSSVRKECTDRINALYTDWLDLPDPDSFGWYTDELLTAIHYPRWADDSITVFREVAQRPGDFALVGLVGRVQVADGKIARAGLAWFGMGPTPIKARQVEAALLGQPIDALDVNALAELAIADTKPFDDHHATSEYRRTVGRRVFVAALSEALNLRKAA